MKYKIEGGNLPVVICELEAGETLITEGGAMSWMSPNLQMQTIGGGIGKMFSRAVQGESMFQNIYTAQGGQGMIAMGSSFPGQIMAFDVSANSVVAQKHAFLASEMGVNMDIFFQKRLSAGFFGGEGFIMQRFSGQGTVFLEIDGSVIEYNLSAGQSMMIDTGCLAAMDSTCQIEIESVKGVKNMFFGGEGLFNTKVTGPGRIWLQTMPINNLAGAVSACIPSSN